MGQAINKNQKAPKVETKKIRIENPTKKPLQQIEMNLPKKMPNFSRYDFFPDESVVNIATGSKMVPVQLVEKGYGYRLSSDKGKREWVYKADILELFKPVEQPQEERMESGRKRYYTRKTDKKTYKRLTKAQIDEILKIQNPKQVELAEKYQVSESTISRLINQKTRLKSYYN